jgi:hypothetical protein
VLAAATTEGALPKGTRVAKVKALEGCYDSIVPGTLRGKQYKGEYGEHLVLRPYPAGAAAVPASFRIRRSGGACRQLHPS